MANPPAPARRPKRIVLVIVLAVVAAVAALLGHARAKAHWHWKQAENAIRAEDFEKARAHLAICRRARPNNSTYAFEAARVARRDRDYRSARSLLSAAAEFGHPPDEVHLEELLLAVQQSGWRGNHEVMIEQLEKRPADAARIREVLAYAFYADLLLSTAMKHAEAWVELEPWSGAAWQLIGEIKETSRDRNGAMEAFGMAVELNPRSVRAQVGYGDGLMRQLRPEDALVHYQKALELNPRERDARLGMTRVYLQLDRLSDAGPVVAGLVADFAQDAEILGLAGRVALADGRPAEGEALLSRSADKVKNLVVLQDLQAALSRQGKVTEARAMEERIARLRQDFDRLDELVQTSHTSFAPAPRVEMGQILIRNGLHREGAAWLYDALRCAPEYRPAHVALADYHAARGQMEQAAHHRSLAGNQ